MILIGADLVPTNSNMLFFENGDVKTLIGEELLQLMKTADCRIFNLEVPLCDQKAPILKCGPNLIASEKSVNGLKAMNVNVVTLANNHTLDQGEQGLRTTCDILAKNGIDYLGAGNTPEEAAKPYFFAHKNKKIGIYACAEHEFTIVSNVSAGANPFDPLNSLDHIAEAKKQCDYLIVLYHGGKEHYRYPSVQLQKTCRKIVEKGADLVVCQHSHCIGCEEKYGNGTIVYGQGNFLFDDAENECWKTGLMIRLSDELEISYIPLEKKDMFVRLAAEQAEEILNAFAQRGEQIKEPAFLEENYNEFADKMLKYYLLSISGNRRNLVYKVINKILRGKLDEWYLQNRYKRNKLVQLENYIECEAHRELLLAGIRSARKEG